MTARNTQSWEFRLAAGARTGFGRYHGPDGTWTAPFRRSPGSIEFLLRRNPAIPSRCLTIDRGENRAIEIADFPKLGRRMIRDGEAVDIIDIAHSRPFKRR